MPCRKENYDLIYLRTVDELEVEEVSSFALLPLISSFSLRSHHGGVGVVVVGGGCAIVVIAREVCRSGILCPNLSY